MRRKKQEWLEEHERKMQETRERMLSDKESALDRERERGQSKLNE